MSSTFQEPVGIEVMNIYGALPEEEAAGEYLHDEDSLAAYYADIVGTGLLSIRIGE